MKFRKIIHFDLDAFFCAVEELKNPSLKQRAFAVGGSPEGRGVVSSCSYAARQMGIHSAMPMSQAKRICSQLIIISGSYKDYIEASNDVMRIIDNVTPLVEKISIDEAFLDVSDLPQNSGEIAKNIQLEIQKRTQLPCSLGVSTNKLVAKIANDFGKKGHTGNDYPRKITVVNEGEEEVFLAPLPVNMMWGVGQKTNERLLKMGINTIGELAAISEIDMQKMFGKSGLVLSNHSRGIDVRPVGISHERKSISQERTFEKDISNKATVLNKINELSEQVVYSLRKNGYLASTIKIKIRWADFSTITRQISLQRPTDLESEIIKQASKLFEENWREFKKIRLIGVGVSNLSEHAKQLSLWDGPEEKERKLIGAMDDIREKYGNKSIYKGKL